MLAITAMSSCSWSRCCGPHIVTLVFSCHAHRPCHVMHLLIPVSVVPSPILPNDTLSSVPSCTLLSLLCSPLVNMLCLIVGVLSAPFRGSGLS
jgi:hypothetical protein